jgi:hypothetical protein
MAADIPVEEAKSQLLAIQKSALQNQKCIDCGAPSPTWASPMYGSNPPIRFSRLISSIHVFTMFRCPSIIRSPSQFRKEYNDG